jgi:hypothetical protein
MNALTSMNSGLSRGSHIAGVSVAIISTSVRKVINCESALPIASGSSTPSSRSHGISVVAFHWRVTASS